MESLELSTTKLRLRIPIAAAALALAAGSALTQGQEAQPAEQAQPPLAPLTIEGDPERGRQLAATCAGCHAIPGYRNAYPSFHVPKLGGQNADYLEIALQGYRRGSRAHETMRAQASSLSDQDIADVSAYLEGLDNSDQQGISGASANAILAGQQKSAACVPCHGPAGVAQASQWPNIAGQHASYLEQALSQYKTGEREDLVMGPMVAPLDAETIEQLAAYFAAQPGLHTPDEM